MMSKRECEKGSVSATEMFDELHRSVPSGENEIEVSYSILINICIVCPAFDDRTFTKLLL